MVPDEAAPGFTVVNIVMEHMDGTQHPPRPRRATVPAPPTRLTRPPPPVAPFVGAPGLTALDLLRQHNDAGHSLPEPLVWHIFQQACRAVAHLHAQSPPIAHRDLKVENLLLSSGEPMRSTVKLCDFGSCTTAAGAYTSPQAMAREAENIEKYTTPQYRAPEMVDLHSGMEVDHRVDLWALGCLLFKLCFLRTPFEDRGGACVCEPCVPRPCGAWRSPALNLRRVVRLCMRPGSLQTMGVLSGRSVQLRARGAAGEVATIALTALSPSAAQVHRPQRLGIL